MRAGGIPAGDDDDALLTELRALAGRVDPIPADAVAAARSALAWRTMDAELAELVEDADDALAGVRSGDQATLLTFRAGSLTVELEVLPAGRRRRLLGQLVPPAEGTVDVRHGGGTAVVVADEVGRFTADDVAPGPVSLRCSTASGVVETDWFLA